MKKLIPLFARVLFILAAGSGSSQALADNLESSKTAITKSEKQAINVFLPKGYKIFEEIIRGDLNNDGKKDLVVIIKDTKKENFVYNSHEEKVDRNRRGIIILFNNGNSYKLALENKECFSSENEEGGGYYPPELSVRETLSKSFVLQ